MGYHKHLAQVNDRVGLIFMSSLFTAAIILAVFLRLFARRLMKLSNGADDWLALTALLLVLILNSVFIAGTVQGAITGHSPVVNDWPVSTDLEHLVQKYKYVFQSTEKIAFGIIKLSLLCLWERILGPDRTFQIACRTMMVIVTLWTLAFFGATIFQCGTNWKLNWAPIGIFLTQCSDTLDMLTVFTATDLLTDFVIMLMPTPIIWGLHLPIRKKLGLISIFMVALFTVGAGIARMYIYLTTSYDKEDNPDFIADFTLFILWSEIEVNVAMLVCCMPVLAPVVGKARDAICSVATRSASKWALLSADHTEGNKFELPHWLDMGKRSEHP